MRLTGPTAQYGMSLVETLIALGIFAVVIQASSTAYLYVAKSGKQAEVRTLLDQNAKYLADYLTFRLQSIGGGSVRPWSAIWVEDNCAARGSLPDCQGSDRVTLVEPDATLPECSITAFAAPDLLTFTITAGTCCLTTAYDQRQAVLVNGDYYSQQFLYGVNTAGGNCTARIQAGQATAGINNPDPNNWVGGTAVVASVSTLFVDNTTHELHEFQDSNNNGIMEGFEVRSLADNFIDLQVALGYDANSDGRVTDLGNDQDEWLFNSTGVNEAMGSGGLAGATSASLRMVAIGVVIGSPIAVPPFNMVSVLNGPLRTLPRWQLGKSLTKVKLRNLGIFLAGG